MACSWSHRDRHSAIRNGVRSPWASTAFLTLLMALPAPVWVSWTPPARAGSWGNVEEAGGSAAGSPEAAEQAAGDLEQQGDRAWSRRARRTASGDVEAVPSEVEEAVSAYRRALERDPDDPMLRTKLLCALIFQGEHAVEGEDAVAEHFARTRDVAQEGIERLMEAVGGQQRWKAMDPGERARALVESTPHGASELAHLLLESAVAWGRWGDTVGKLEAANQGVATRLRRLARTALELDETVSDAGPHRFLGRLHTVAPHIPFITGWVDRDLAIEHLSRAVEIAPGAPENGLFLAQAILEHKPQWRDRAIQWLKNLAEREPREGELMGDHRALEGARKLLRRETGGGTAGAG